jgi:hypothetical protein
LKVFASAEGESERKDERAATPGSKEAPKRELR